MIVKDLQRAYQLNKDLKMALDLAEHSAATIGEITQYTNLRTFNAVKRNATAFATYLHEHYTRVTVGSEEGAEKYAGPYFKAKVQGSEVEKISDIFISWYNNKNNNGK